MDRRKKSCVLTHTQTNALEELVKAEMCVQHAMLHMRNIFVDAGRRLEARFVEERGEILDIIGADLLDYDRTYRDTVIDQRRREAMPHVSDLFEELYRKEKT